MSEMMEISTPPERYERFKHHWLFSERSSLPTVCYWDNKTKLWHGISETQSISPQEMFRRGWRWYAVCLPPLSPYKDSPLKNGILLEDLVNT
jgi:hypothetical protein